MSCNICKDYNAVSKCDYCKSPICINCECSNLVVECDHLCPNCIDKHNHAWNMHYMGEIVIAIICLSLFCILYLLIILYV